MDSLTGDYVPGVETCTGPTAPAKPCLECLKTAHDPADALDASAGFEPDAGRLQPFLRPAWAVGKPGEQRRDVTGPESD